MLKAVIIDVDDTLCLTEAACFDLENETLANMGRPLMERAVHRATWGQPLFEAIVKRSPGIDVEAFKAAYHPLIAEYVESGRLDKIPAANYEAMDRLIDAGKKLLLLTSRTHAELQHMLAPDHLLMKRVSALYYRDNMQFHKPDPRAFAELLEQQALRPEECVYVGDSVTDAAAANAAGIKFICSLESGLRQREDFDGYNVGAFINIFPEIVLTLQT